MHTESPFAHFLTVDEVACRYGVSKSFVYKRTMSREIPFRKVGKRALFDPAITDEYFLRTTLVNTK